MGPCIRLAFVSCCDLLLLALCPGVTYFIWALCPGGTIPWHCVLMGLCLMLELFPGVTYFLCTLCPGGTIPYVGIVFRGDHALCWILFMM